MFFKESILFKLLGLISRLLLGVYSSLMFLSVTNFLVDFDSGNLQCNIFNIFGQRIVSSN